MPLTVGPYGEDLNVVDVRIFPAKTLGRSDAFVIHVKPLEGRDSVVEDHANSRCEIFGKARLFAARIVDRECRYYLASVHSDNGLASLDLCFKTLHVQIVYESPALTGIIDKRSVEIVLHECVCA